MSLKIPIIVDHMKILLLDKKQTSNNKSCRYADNKCFQYVVTVALNHEEIGKDSERITKIKPFVNKY